MKRILFFAIAASFRLREQYPKPSTSERDNRDSPCTGKFEERHG